MRSYQTSHVLRTVSFLNKRQIVTFLLLSSNTNARSVKGNAIRSSKQHTPRFSPCTRGPCFFTSYFSVFLQSSVEGNSQSLQLPTFPHHWKWCCPHKRVHHSAPVVDIYIGEAFLHEDTRACHLTKVLTSLRHAQVTSEEFFYDRVLS